MPLYEVERISLEAISAIVCFILLKFMIRSYQATGENRYLGLPLGFGFLGASYAFSALSYSQIFSFSNWGWIQLFIRGFAFLFLAITYYFSKSEKNVKLLWNTSFGVLIIMFTSLILFAIFSPEISRSDYVLYYILIRVVSLLCVFYIIVHSLARHVKKPESTLLAPLGYVLLAIDQYSSLIWVVDASYFALFVGLLTRLGGLVLFLLIAQRTFFRSKRKGE
ncbi:hypothetical protein JW988_05285 [Candidatus Bathyarchaeota archaeon]|nr:hypothetical protein [Candidatus Bathyarchaeota archaeon]